MDDEQQIGYLVSPEDRARIDTRSAASDSIIAFQAGRIAVLEAEARQRDGQMVERGALVGELQQAVVELTRQVIDLGGQPAVETPTGDGE